MVPRTSLRSVRFSYLPTPLDASLQSLRPFFPLVTADKIHPIHFQNYCLVNFLTCHFPPPFNVTRFFIVTASFIFPSFFPNHLATILWDVSDMGTRLVPLVSPRPLFPQISYSWTHVARSLFSPPSLLLRGPSRKSIQFSHLWDVALRLKMIS